MKKKPGRAEYLRAKIISKNNGTFLTIHGRKGAGVISSLTGADGIVEIPFNYKNVKVGELLKFYPFNHRCLWNLHLNYFKFINYKLSYWANVI